MIRRNTAGQVVYLPKLALTADGTAVTSSASMTVAKDGVESAAAGTLAHSAGGVWKYTPTQGETDCAILALILTATNADPVVLNLVTTAADTSAVALGANTTTPPTAAANASATRTELATELGRIDAAISTRLASAGYTAPPSAATISTQVAADLATAHGAGSWATATGFSTLNSSDVQTAVSVVLVAYDPPTRSEATSDKDEVLTSLSAAKGATFDTTTDSLEAIRNRGDAAWTTGAGGSSSIVIQPLQGTQTHRLQGSNITVKIREKVLIGFNVQDVDGNPVDLDALTLQIRIQSLDKATTVTIPNADISRSGDSFTFRLTEAVTVAVREWTWSLRETEYDAELIGGSLNVVYAP